MRRWRIRKSAQSAAVEVEGASVSILAAYERPLASSASTKAQWRIRNCAAFGWLHSAATCKGDAPEASRELTETCSSVARCASCVGFGRGARRARVSSVSVADEASGKRSRAVCWQTARARLRSLERGVRDVPRALAALAAHQRGVAAAHGGVERLGALDGGARLEQQLAQLDVARRGRVREAARQEGLGARACTCQCRERTLRVSTEADCAG